MFTETAPPARPAPVFSRKNPFPAPLQARRTLSGPGSEKSTFHYEFSLEESGLVFEVGDSLGIFPANTPELVDEILSLTGFNGAEQVICATGFARGYAHDSLLAALVADHGLATAGSWIVLEPDSAVGALTHADRTLAVAGVAGQWAFPAADTLTGAKYAARGFLRRVKTCRSR